jgi:site-specific recombinase XerD
MKIQNHYRNRSLRELVLSTIHAASGSRNTAYTYERAIGLFLAFVDENKGALLPSELQPLRPLSKLSESGRRKIWIFKGPARVLSLVDVAIVGKFRESRKEMGESDRSIKNRMVGVRAFLSMAFRCGVLSSEQARELGITMYRSTRTSNTRSTPQNRILTPEEVAVLRASPDLRTVKGIRDRAIIDTFLYAALAREEVSNLQMNQFRLVGNTWRLKIKWRGRQSREVKIHQELLSSLNRWFKAKSAEIGQKHGWVFTGVNGSVTSNSRIDAALIGKLIALYGYKAGIAEAQGPTVLKCNDLRRTAARNAFDNGADLLTIQALLGYSNPKITAEYIGAIESKGERAIDHIRY